MNTMDKKQRYKRFCDLLSHVLEEYPVGCDLSLKQRPDMIKRISFLRNIDYKKDVNDTAPDDKSSFGNDIYLYEFDSILDIKEYILSGMSKLEQNAIFN